LACTSTHLDSKFNQVQQRKSKGEFAAAARAKRKKFTQAKQKKKAQRAGQQHQTWQKAASSP